MWTHWVAAVATEPWTVSMAQWVWVWVTVGMSMRVAMRLLGTTSTGLLSLWLRLLSPPVLGS